MFSGNVESDWSFGEELQSYGIEDAVLSYFSDNEENEVKYAAGTGFKYDTQRSCGDLPGPLIILELSCRRADHPCVADTLVSSQSLQFNREHLYSAFDALFAVRAETKPIGRGW